MAFLTEADRKYTKPEDICAHLGDEYGKFMGAIVPPIFQNTLFVQPTENNGVAADGYGYTRGGNPTVEIVERKVAALEGGDGALCFASGMAAITSAILHFVKAGCHVVMVAGSYGGSFSFIRGYLKNKFNVDSTLVEGKTLAEIEAAIRPETTLIYLESPCSFTFKMQDLEAVAQMARARNIGTVIDGTYGTPLHQHPLAHGIDIVCHTASKYIGGHSDIVAGVLVARREIIQSIHDNEIIVMGAIMDPHQAWLMLRGIRTLPIRLKQHGENGMKVARFLENHPKVAKVFYPGSDTYEQKDLFEKYLSGTNGLLSFVPKCSQEDAQKIINALHYFQHGCSWGGFESLALVIGMNQENQALGDPEYLIRMHVGLEDVDSLIEDLEQALSVI